MGTTQSLVNYGFLLFTLLAMLFSVENTERAFQRDNSGNVIQENGVDLRCSTDNVMQLTYWLLFMGISFVGSCLLCAFFAEDHTRATEAETKENLIEAGQPSNESKVVLGNDGKPTGIFREAFSAKYLMFAAVCTVFKGVEKVYIGKLAQYYADYVTNDTELGWFWQLDHKLIYPIVGGTLGLLLGFYIPKIRISPAVLMFGCLACLGTNNLLMAIDSRRFFVNYVATVLCSVSSVFFFLATLCLLIPGFFVQEYFSCLYGVISMTGGMASVFLFKNFGSWFGDNEYWASLACIGLAISIHSILWWRYIRPLNKSL